VESVNRIPALLVVTALALTISSGDAAPPRWAKAYHIPETQLFRGSIEPVELAPFEASGTLVALLAEYEPGIREMEKPIGRVEGEFEFIRGDGPLGSWMCDAMREGASRALGQPIDIAFLNSGGIRDTLPSGPISEVNILELMPFDNELVVLTLEGWQVEWLADKFAASTGGFPLSGAELIADEEKRLVTLVIGGRPLDRARTYTLATTDYLLISGDNLGIPSEVAPAVESHKMVRDAMMDYARERADRGEPVTPPLDGWRYCYAGKIAEEVKE